jgi:hypothetical protein
VFHLSRSRPRSQPRGSRGRVRAPSYTFSGSWVGTVRSRHGVSRPMRGAESAGEGASGAACRREAQ